MNSFEIWAVLIGKPSRASWNDEIDTNVFIRPSKGTILSHLQLLHESRSTDTADHRVALGVIRLLSWLPRLTLAEQSQLIVPDTEGLLRPFNAICYNDIGPRACLVDVGSNFLAHSNISESLANELGLRRLGLTSVDNQVDDLDMGEDLLTTIRNRLREYTDSQLLLEFFANASDASATEFDVLLDEDASPDKILISSNCRAFQHAPALIVHNNSIFTDEDFQGILRTGIGGKAGRRDTIGQFGLGALTMFHVTEVRTVTVLAVGKHD
jgi:sacsin